LAKRVALIGIIELFYRHRTERKLAAIFVFFFATPCGKFWQKE
jgi:hypothetical protein